MAEEKEKKPLIEDENEEEILVFNRSVWHKPSQFILATLLTVSPVPLAFALGGVDEPWKRWLLGIIFGVGCLWLIVYLFTVKVLATYRITPRYCTSEVGFVSRRIAEVEIDHIRNINVSQSFLQRILGIGMVEISSAGGTGVEVTFESVPDPVEIRRLINTRRNDDDKDSKDGE
jgi:uncharacterized membrane protein YdbT with pleckstrin-like domain